MCPECNSNNYTWREDIEDEGYNFICHSCGHEWFESYEYENYLDEDYDEDYSESEESENE
jgi:DNA-directed RNA polymerase subunit M/transcription elongation factor TFIIS